MSSRYVYPANVGERSGRISRPDLLRLRVRQMSAKISRWLRKEGVQAALFITPFAIVWLMFQVWPVIYGFIISLYHWDPLRGNRFIGFGNYSYLASDARFINALVNTLYFAALTIPLIVGIGLIYAIFLHRRDFRGKTFVESALFFPYLLNVSIISLIWGWLFDADFGIVRYYLSLIGIHAPVFLNDEKWVIPAIAFATAWWLAGYRMVIFQAALKDIPEEIIEAAEIDGASGWITLRSIVLPLIKPAILFAIVLSTISGFRVLGQVMIMSGGGPGRASEVLTLYLYRYAFDYLQMGRAAAAGFILFLLILAVTLLSFKWLGLESEY